RLCGVVEDVVELGPAVHQVVEHGLAGLAAVLGHPVQDLTVADLILDLGGERQLALEGRRPGDPRPLREGPHHLGVGVHLDELQGGQAVLVGHPLARLDLLARVDARLELGHAVVIRHGYIPPGLHRTPTCTDDPADCRARAQAGRPVSVTLLRVLTRLSTTSGSGWSAPTVTTFTRRRPATGRTTIRTWTVPEAGRSPKRHWTTLPLCTEHEPWLETALTNSAPAG